ncbi:ATP synthase F0 subcomplex A subunit [Thermodesulfobium acidiphilum]|uniref:ATP synthase subunit a n=1 Tax=Thermodesulfobium acidiphilum TaxID=1794699 RepID=A0A2R4VZP2_THEAF|nr:F0F1 ATP synthase subunit A [Thermodesulfobium acidiphilum]AWB09934.1 ATP synthase F0 subcomplex A subunit [Thermodesulfobium acidiphilum]
MHIAEEFMLHKIIPINIGGFDLSITQAVLWMWIASIIMMLYLIYCSRSMTVVPSNRLVTLFEVLIDFVRKDLVESFMHGKDVERFFPLIASIFFFIFASNFIGIIPGTYTPTANINTTAILAIFVFILYNVLGVFRNGLVGYLKSIVVPGLPAPIIPVVFVIEVFSHFARPLSLAIRLFANMMAGHIIIGVLIYLALLATGAFMGGIMLGSVSFAASVGMYFLEVFVKSLQAIIFAVLTSMYIAGAVAPEH